MTVEFRHDPNLWGGIKEAAITRFPDLYKGARLLKNRLVENLEDRRRFPYISDKNIEGLHFRMWVANRREQSVVDGLCFERELLSEMVRCVRPGDNILDIGAATGTHTIPCAIKTGQDGVVYSFEPDSQCARGLRNNLDLNGIGNVVVLETALWREDTQLDFCVGGRSGAPSRIRQNGFVSEGFGRQLISVRSIESMVQSGQVKPPDVLKIDVEGAGFSVLQGLGSYCPREIFMEVHPLLEENKDQIVELLGSKGYQVVWEQPRGGEIHMHFQLN